MKNKANTSKKKVLWYENTNTHSHTHTHTHTRDRKLVLLFSVLFNGRIYGDKINTQIPSLEHPNIN